MSAMADSSRFVVSDRCSSSRSSTGRRRSSVAPLAFKGGTEDFAESTRSGAGFVDLLRRCSESRDLAKGQQLHGCICRSGYVDDNGVVGNWLIQMYLKCGSLEDASNVFDQLLKKSQVNLVAWTSMIAACARYGKISLALFLFAQMQLEGTLPDRITLVTVFEACGKSSSLEAGKRIHAYVPCDFDVVVGSCIITMYGKCGSLEDARGVFQAMKQRNEVVWNSLMGAYLLQAQEREALEIFWEMLQGGFVPSRATFVTVLGACANLEDLESGKLVHRSLAEGGFDADVVVQSALVNMYGKCGSLEDALRIFDTMPRQDVILWSSIVSACVKCGDYDQSFRHFQRMQLEGNRPNAVTLVNILSACDSPEALAQGRKIHGFVLEAGFESDVIVGNAIVSMYGKCGSLEDAWAVFHGVPLRSVVTCNGMMGACALLGDSSEALKLFQYMLHQGIAFDNVTLVNAFCACSNSSAAAFHGEFFHALMVERGIQPDIFVANALVNMYGKCGRVETAFEIFQQLPEQDVRTWNAMILAYVQNGEEDSGLSVFRYMMHNGFKPDEVTFAVTLNSCSRAEALREVHLLITETGITNSVVENAVVVMYGRLGLLEEGFAVFDALDDGNTTTWNVMIAACTQFGRMNKGFHLFREMQQRGVLPNKGTLLIMINGSTSAGEADDLRCYLTNELLDSHNLLKIALVGLHSRCGNIVEALDVFGRLEAPPTTTWNAVLSAFVQNGRDAEAVEFFREMQQAGATPDKCSFVAIVKAFANLRIPEAEVEWIETSVAESEVDDELLLGNAFIGMFGRFGNASRARQVFDGMHERDVVSWNALMGVCEQLQQGKETLELFRQMLQEGIAPDKITILKAFNACANPPALQEGRGIQAWVEQTSFWWCQKIRNAVLHIYAKCGSRDEARKVFEQMKGQRDAVSWNALLGACGSSCRGKLTMELFREMQLEGISADAITFTTILSACSHGGLLSEGVKWFGWMQEDYSVGAVTGHYSCIVDLLGRMGRVAEAEDVAERMPGESDCILWTTLLGACKVHGESERGKRAADKLVKLDSQVSSAYVMLSSLFREGKVISPH